MTMRVRVPAVRSAARAVCLFVLLAVAGSARAQTVPLEQLLGAPFPSSMTAAPAGGHIAWVQNHEGARSIMVASPPSYEPRALTRYAADDGVEIGPLFWAGGDQIVYGRGGSPNRAGEYANPTSDPTGVQQSLWRVGLAGGEPVRIGGGGVPAVAPRGEVVAFTRGGQVWTAPLSGEGEPAELFRARGGIGSLRWSPDGRKLAFVSSRGDHAFVGVYDLTAKSITWLSPGVDEDGSPVWSPEGTRVAFIRTPASTELTLFKPVRIATPWSILVADVTTGEATEIWRAREGAGSAFRGVVAPNQLLWTASERIVFPWEADGWTHLYSVSAAGGEAVLLTPGAFEVEYVTLAPNGRTIVYNSNQDDIDRRHLWRVDANGGPPRRVTGGAGIEWDPAMTSDGDHVAFLASDARAPAHPMILGAGDGAEPRPLVPVPADFPTDALVEPEQVVYTAADGMRIHAQLFRPRGIAPGERRPAVVHMHGGSRRQMLLGWNYSSYYHNAYALNQHLAARGYVVLSINYRSGIGYGMEFREAIDYGAAGGSEFQDVLGAGLYLANRPDVDPERIGLWGGSYGGYLTALGLARASDLFAAGVDFHGVHDWNVGIRTFVPGYNRLEDPESARTAFLASPMAWLDGWRSPVLVIHGDDDRNVSFAETVALVEALRDRDVHVEILVFPDEVHGFLRHANWLRSLQATADFFDRMLRDGASANGR